MAEKKTTAKATAAKKAETKTAEVKKTVAKKAPAKKAAAPASPAVYVQFNGKELLVSDIVDRVKADYRAVSKQPMRSVNVYVKPEDNAAYYVINKVEGKIDLD